MPRKSKRDIITGIEIGTSTIKVVMGEFMPDDVLAIVGVGQAPSLQMQKGEVLDVEKVLGQLARAVSAAETASGIVIDGPIFAAVTGAHIQPVVAVGRTMIQSNDRTVSEDDVITAVQGARSYSLPPDQKIIHTCERVFQVDDGAKHNNPIGRCGDWLAAEVLLVVGQHSNLQTVCSMIEELMSYRARDIAFSGVADCFAAFGPEEAEQGQLLIDIGAGVTEYVVYHVNGCYFAGQLTLGCDHIANDLAIGLNLQYARCKALITELRDQNCSACRKKTPLEEHDDHDEHTEDDEPDGVDHHLIIKTGSGSARSIPRRSIERVVELRLREVFELVRDELKRHDALERVGGGISICGGGAMIPGVEAIAYEVLGRRATIARPRLLSGQEDILNSPSYMTPVGLIRWGKLMLSIDEIELQPTLGRQLLHDARRFVHIVRESFKL